MSKKRPVVKPGEDQAKVELRGGRFVGMAKDDPRYQARLEKRRQESLDRRPSD